MNRVVAENYTVFTAVAVGTNSVNPFSAYSGLTLALLTFEGSGLRYRLDGVTAASGSGHLVSAGSIVNLAGSQTITQFNAICPTVTGTIMASLGTR